MSRVLDPDLYRDDRGAGTALRNLCATDGAIIEIGAGVVTLPLMALNFRPGTKIKGQGPGHTTLLWTGGWSPGGVCGFQFAPELVLENLTLAGPTKPDDKMNHVCVAGIGGPSQPLLGTPRVTLRNVDIEGGNFQLYYWAPKWVGWRIIYDGGRVVGGRWLVTNGNSMGGDSGTIEMWDVILDGDFARGWAFPSEGALRGRLHGITARGGRTIMRGGAIDLIGAPEATDVRGVYTPYPTSPEGYPSDYEGGAKDGIVDVRGVLICVNGRGAKNARVAEPGSGEIWVDRVQAAA